MKRPEIKDFFHEKTDLETVHSEYTKSPHLFSYSSDLDRYIDYLEDQLSANEGKICTPSMEEIFNEAQRRKAKHSVQYADYSLDTWTVANDLLEHRKINLLNDGSVRKVRIEYEM